MKKQRRPIEVFSLSFLDVISCAFGAVVMLILLAKNGVQGEFSEAADTSAIISQIQEMNDIEAQLSNISESTKSSQSAAKKLLAQKSSLTSDSAALETDIARARQNLLELNDQAQGLEQTIVSRQRAAIDVGKATKRDEEVGGIPVDSDYVIFIVDTSGSMKSMWNKVLNTMEQVLNNHPQVKGFQVISDNGLFLRETTAGRWRSDNSVQRAAVLAEMQSWSGASNSSPVEGISTALRVYSKRTDSLALYVFGDDYSGASYDMTLQQINRLNTANDGTKIARIHAIGFKRPKRGITNDMLRFATLMSAVSEQNNGTFISK